MTMASGDRDGEPRFPGVGHGNPRFGPRDGSLQEAPCFVGRSPCRCRRRRARSPPRGRARAPARSPPFSASLASSRCARPCTQPRPSSAIALVRSSRASAVRPTRGARRAALVVPERVLAEHARRACPRRSAPFPSSRHRSASAGRPARRLVDPISSQTSRLRGYRFRSIVELLSAHRRTASRGCRGGPARSARRPGCRRGRRPPPRSAAAPFPCRRRSRPCRRSSAAAARAPRRGSDTCRR